MKTRIKRMIIVLGAAGMLLGMSGCGSRKTQESQNVQESRIESEASGTEGKDTEHASEKVDFESDRQQADSDIAENGTESEAETAAESETETKADVSGMKMEGESETKQPLNGYTVGIDPGHQGPNIDMSEQEPNGPGSSTYKAKATAGTTGRFSHVPEYQLNLDISLKLRDELEERGYRVVMTREDNDTAISNSERALLAAEQGSDIYVRIHANGSDDSSVNGALAMAPSPENPYVSHLAADSYRLSENILNAYCASTGFSSLGIQYYDDMTGINWSKVPVMILEMGFMTNENEDYAMQNQGMQNRMVQGIANGIDGYFGIDRTQENEVGQISEEVQTNEKNGEEKSVEEKAGGMAGDGLIEDPDVSSDRAVIGSEAQADGPIPMLQEQFLNGRSALGERWSVSIANLEKNEVYEYQAEERMQSASVIKVFIMGAVYDRICYPSTPERQILMNESYEGELRSLLEQMITVSDNDAANRLIEILGEGDFQKGAQVVNQFCQENNYLMTSVGRRFLEENPTGDNYTSAADCRKILTDILEGNCVEREASEKMLGILKQQTNTSKIPAGLPAGVGTANKTGEMPEGYGLGCIENDMAIVFSEEGNYVITVLSNDLGGRNEEAKQVIREISGSVYDWFASQWGTSAEGQV